MSGIAVVMLIISVLAVPGGLTAATIFLVRQPELASDPELDPGLSD
jgi:hypothetical protein